MEETPPKFRKYLRFSTIGLELGLAVIIGLWVGQTLDEWWGTDPWMLLLFTLFGVVAGFRSLYRLLMDLQRDEKEEEAHKKQAQEKPK